MSAFAELFLPQHISTWAFPVRPIHFRPHYNRTAMSKVKSKIRKAKGREEDENGVAAVNNLEDGKGLLCCLPSGQGAVGFPKLIGFF